MIFKTGNKIIINSPDKYKIQGRIPYKKVNNSYIVSHVYRKYINSLFNVNLPKTFIPKLKLPDLVMPHQKEGIEKLIHLKKYPLFFDTGTGKTLTLLLTIDYLIKTKKIKTPLIVCPLDLIEGSWIEQWEDFQNEFGLNFNFSPINLHSLSKKKNRENLICQNLEKNNKLFLINYEMYVKFPNVWWHYIDLKTFDESSRVINYKANRTQVVYQLSKSPKLKYLTMLSGTPTHNSFYEYYTQINSCDPLVFGDRINDFNKFFTFDRYSNPHIRKELKNYFINIVQESAMFVDKREVLKDLPELSKINIYCKISKRQEADYKKLVEKIYNMDDSVNEFELNGEKVKVSNKLVETLKLRQITSGYIQNDGKVKEYQNNYKLKSLLENIDRIKEKQIVWCNYIAEIEMLKNALKNRAVYIYGNISKEEVTRRRKLFKNEKQILVATIPKFQEGHNLQFCHIMHYLSRCDTYKSEHQATSRIERKGQLHKMLVFFYMIKDTIDIKLDKMIKQKKNIRDLSFKDLI